jgi:acetyl esterase/lipase
MRFERPEHWPLQEGDFMSNTQGLAGARDGVVVPEHFVPTPTTISAQAQAFLRLKLPVHSMPALNDIAGWKAFREATDASILKMTEKYVARYPGKLITHQLSASPLYEVTPDNAAPENSKRAIYYIHGGGFTGGGGIGAANLAFQMAGMARCKVYSTDYRLAPEFPFPLPLDDTLEGYRFIFERHGARNVGVFGPSAGANLAAAMTLKARDQGLPMPAACAMHSCPSDMSTYGDSGYTIESTCPPVQTGRSAAATGGGKQAVDRPQVAGRLL